MNVTITNKSISFWSKVLGFDVDIFTKYFLAKHLLNQRTKLVIPKNWKFLCRVDNMDKRQHLPGISQLVKAIHYNCDALYFP